MELNVFLQQWVTSFVKDIYCLQLQIFQLDHFFVTVTNTMVHLVVGNAFRGEQVQKGEKDIPINFHIMQKTLKDHKEQVNVFFQKLSP